MDDEKTENRLKTVPIADGEELETTFKITAANILYEATKLRAQAKDPEIRKSLAKIISFATAQGYALRGAIQIFEGGKPTPAETDYLVAWQADQAEMQLALMEATGQLDNPSDDN